MADLYWTRHSQLSLKAKGRLSSLTHRCELPTCPWTFAACGIPCFVLLFLTHPNFLRFSHPHPACLRPSLPLRHPLLQANGYQWQLLTRSSHCCTDAMPGAWASVTSYSSLAGSCVLPRLRPPAWPPLDYCRGFLASLLIFLFSILPSLCTQRQSRTLCV